MKLNDEVKFVGAGNHEPAKAVPQRLPRVDNHMKEWVDAIYGGPGTFSDFDLGGHLTEIGLAGNVALRMQRDIEWDGLNMKAVGMPEADAFVHTRYRAKWL